SPDGIITALAGNGTLCYGPNCSLGDGGPATSAALASPGGVAVDGSGNVFIADYFSGRIRKVSPGGIITTVAGNGMPGSSGDRGLATSAGLAAPGGVAVDAGENGSRAGKDRSR